VSICPQCEAQNEDHYKFCLACGNELDGVATPRIADDASVPVTEKPIDRPQIADLKSRLDALRVAREAAVDSQEPSKSSVSESVQPLVGWTSPPVGALLVSAAPSTDTLLSPETMAGEAHAVVKTTDPESPRETPQQADLELGPDKSMAEIDLSLAEQPNEDVRSDAGPEADEGISSDVHSEREGAEAKEIDGAPTASSELFDDDSLPADSIGQAEGAPNASLGEVDDTAVSDVDLDTEGQGSAQSLTAGTSKMRTSTHVIEQGNNGLAATRPAMTRVELAGGGHRDDMESGLVEPQQTEAADDRPTTVSPMLPDTDANICDRCGAQQPTSFRFCGDCGAKIDSADISPSAPVVVASIGQMVLIHADGSEGEQFDLGDGNLVIGRNHPDPLFASDPYLSPEHVRLSLTDGWMTMDDLGSQNGVYIRLHGEIRLVDGDRFRIGQQLIRFESLRGRLADMAAEADGTHCLGSPTSGLWGKLVRVLNIGSDLCEWTLTTPEVYLGRDRGTITLPEDVFVSGSHCRLKRDGDNARISDLGSTNGTYLRIKEATALSSGDLVLLGQQLFRFDIN
jgi:pSer/pThr/pTyr-binding forkhead associated (FHA) protein